jgi:FKBP12-rapamycin complex-associated protein
LFFLQSSESVPGDNHHPPLLDLAPSSEEYYPTVAIHALMRILRDSTLSQHHNMVVQAVMFIFRSLGMKCVPFLPHIIPHFLFAMRRGEDSLRDSLFQQLSSLVSLVKSHIRNYLDGIFELIHQFWFDSSLLPQILSLIEEISLALKDEFKVYLADLMPHFLSILHADKTEKRQPTLKVYYFYFRSQNIC